MTAVGYIRGCGHSSEAHITQHHITRMPTMRVCMGKDRWTVKCEHVQLHALLPLKATTRPNHSNYPVLSVTKCTQWVKLSRGIQHNLHGKIRSQAKLGASYNRQHLSSYLQSQYLSQLRNSQKYLWNFKKKHPLLENRFLQVNVCTKRKDVTRLLATIVFLSSSFIICLLFPINLKKFFKFIFKQNLSLFQETANVQRASINI